jgi:hypothetical protein
MTEQQQQLSHALVHVLWDESNSGSQATAPNKGTAILALLTACRDFQALVLVAHHSGELNLRQHHGREARYEQVSAVLHNMYASL